MRIASSFEASYRNSLASCMMVAKRPSSARATSVTLPVANGETMGMNDDWKGVAGAVAVVVGMGEGEMAVVGWMAVLVGDGGAGVGWGVFLGKTVAVAEGIGSSGRVCGLAQAARAHSDSRQRAERTMARLTTI